MTSLSGESQTTQPAFDRGRCWACQQPAQFNPNDADVWQDALLGGDLKLCVAHWRVATLAAWWHQSPKLPGRRRPGPRPGSLSANWEGYADAAIDELRESGSMTKAAAVTGCSRNTLHKYIARRNPAFYAKWRTGHPNG
jgi:hypothetical protein